MQGVLAFASTTDINCRLIFGILLLDAVCPVYDKFITILIMLYTFGSVWCLRADCRPLPPDDLSAIIHEACGDDNSTAMLTQVILYNVCARGAPSGR